MIPAFLNTLNLCKNCAINLKYAFIQCFLIVFLKTGKPEEKPEFVKKGREYKMFLLICVYCREIVLPEKIFSLLFLLSAFVCSFGIFIQIIAWELLGPGNG